MSERKCGVRAASGYVTGLAVLLGAFTASAQTVGTEQHPVSAGPQPAAAPFAGADGKVVVPPGFLDTTDRRVRDQKPPPTPTEVKALKELDNEALRFTKIGGSYR